MVREVSMDVGAKIRHFRTLQGLSQEKLAWQAGIAPAFLGQLERGLKSPTIKTLEKITDALHISMAEFFAGPAETSESQNRAMQQVMYQLHSLPVESIQKISVIIQNIMDMKK